MAHRDYEGFKPDLTQDIPVAYAVFEPIWDDEKKQVLDTRYVFVNEKYCKLAGAKREDLVGKLFTECYGTINRQWFQFCYEAVVLGKTIRQRVYSPETNHWLDFEVSPTTTPGLCAYTFLEVDKEIVQTISLTRAYKMDNIIIELSKILVNPHHYEMAIQQVLEKMSKIISPARIYILETDGNTISNTFEWCREGVESVMGKLQNLPCGQYMNTWARYLKKNSSIVIEDIEEIKEDDPLVYDLLKMQNIRRLINAPIYDNGEIIGYVGVDNYEKSEELDMQHILESVAFFLGAVMVKEKLMKKLDFLSRYDALTGVYNRNELMEKVDRLELTDQSIGIVYVDDNGLKRLNDTYGHLYGDLHIKKTARILTDCFGKEHVYRAGGDEFVVLMAGVTEEDFQKEVDTYQEKMKQFAAPSVAVGIEWIPNAEKLRCAIHRADQQMYRNKEEYYKNHEMHR